MASPFFGILTSRTVTCCERSSRLFIKRESVPHKILKALSCMLCVFFLLIEWAIHVRMTGPARESNDGKNNGLGLMDSYT